jgi:hypothetical protein
MDQHADLKLSTEADWMLQELFMYAARRMNVDRRVLEGGKFKSRPVVICRMICIRAILQLCRVDHVSHGERRLYLASEDVGHPLPNTDLGKILGMIPSTIWRARDLYEDWPKPKREFVDRVVSDFADYWTRVHDACKESMDARFARPSSGTGADDDMRTDSRRNGIFRPVGAQPVLVNANQRGAQAVQSRLQR